MRLATWTMRASIVACAGVRSWTPAMCSFGITSTCVGATGQWTHAGDSTQRLAALGRIDRDVVVSQAAHPGREAPVPDRLEITTDEACLVGLALRFGLRLQPVAPVAADGVIDRQAEAGRGGSCARRVAKDV